MNSGPLGRFMPCHNREQEEITLKTNHLHSTTSVFRLVMPIALAVASVLLALKLVAAQGTDNLIRVTTTSDSNRLSGWPSVNSNGTMVVFESSGDFLEQGIPEGQDEIWLFETAAMTLTRITTASHSGRDSERPSVNANGSVIAFHSFSDFLNQGIPAYQYEIWLYDTNTMTFTRITTATDSSRDSRNPSLSGDGTVVAFESDSDFLGQGVPTFIPQIWLYDTKTMTFTCVTGGSDRRSEDPSLSADGTVVAFQSASDFLNQGIPSGQIEIWLYDTKVMTFTRVTTASDSSRDSQLPSLSADGTVIAFQSDSDFLNQGIPSGQIEIWLYDTKTMTFTRVTTASSSDRTSSTPSLNADGTVVSFNSQSDFLDEGIPSLQNEVWLYDTRTMTLTRVTVASESGRNSGGTSLSADGTVVAFSSNSDFLDQGITADLWEIWLKRVGYRIYLPLVLRQHQ